MKAQQKTDDTANACEAIHLRLNTRTDMERGWPMPSSNPSDREFRYILSFEENEEERRRAALGFPYRKPI